jgi:signal transduction histidine kinase
MSKLAEWLTENYDDLVTAASERLAGTQEGRESIIETVRDFYAAFIVAAEHIDVTPLRVALLDWVESRSAPSGQAAVRFVDVLNVLKRTVWDLIVERCSPRRAVSLLVVLDRLMEEATDFLTQQEQEATMADLQRRLERMQVEMQRLDKSKSDFIAVAAHELKTPLTLIEGYANMLREEFPADEYPRVALMLGGIANGTSRLRDIIDDMIDVSMIDLNLLVLHFQPVWPRRVVEAVVGELEGSIDQRRQALVLEDFGEADRPILADPERLRQVFKNIVMNAIKYTPDGGHITISARSLPNFIDVQVIDTGIGIDPEDLQRIFDRFMPTGDIALHSSGKTKFKGGGPGLGLAIARGIVDAHGGTIWAESPGCDEKKCPGSIFHVMLPVRATDMPDADMMKLFDITEEEISRRDTL